MWRLTTAWSRRSRMENEALGGGSCGEGSCRYDLIKREARGEEGMTMVVAVLTILFGALAAAGGVQELVVQGILNNRPIPLIGGTLGAASSAILVGAGIALLRQSPRAGVFTRAAALAMVPVTMLIGQIGWGLAGWSVTIVGVGWPLFLLGYFRARSKNVNEAI